MSDVEDQNLFDFGEGLAEPKAKRRRAATAEQPDTPGGADEVVAGGGAGGGGSDDDGTGRDYPNNDELRRLMDYNFLQYASYVIRDRAIPRLEDGLKPVQRRILHSLHEKDDGKFVKVANIVGYCMQFHPHGDASIADALVVLTNKRYLIEGQGNYGNLYTGDRAAASRYIECRLTELSRKEIFNDELTEYVPSYDGRNQEPVTLPCKLPLLLMLGAEGIAVGLSTRILPHNFIELLEAQVAILTKKPYSVYPDFQQGGVMDAAEYDLGRGKVKVRARIERDDSRPNILKIVELPFGTTTESLIGSIEDAAKKGRVKVRSISDFTSESVEIELKVGQGEDANIVEQALFAFTDCEVSLSSRIIAIKENRPVELTVEEVLAFSTKKLVKDLKAELNLNRRKLEKDIHQKTLVQIFVENRIYKRIETCKTYEDVTNAVHTGFEPFRETLTREVTKDDVEMLLGIRIRRISLFDLNKHNEDMDKISKELAEVLKHLDNLTKYVIGYVKGLIRTYKDDYPRLTKISSGFKEIDVKEIAAEQMSLRYDSEKGYFGFGVKDGDEAMTCTNFDKVVMVWADGSYKVSAPPEKLFVDTTMIYCAVVEKKRVMTVVYTADQVTYMKRFTFGGYILNKEYTCATSDAVVVMFADDDPKELFLKYKPAKGQRIHQQHFDLLEMPVKGAKARGNQVTVKTISKISTSRPRGWDDSGPAGAML